MVSTHELEKIFSALIVPMNKAQSINYHELGRLTKRQIEEGAEGFYCCGSSGEGLLLSIEERKRVLEKVLEHAGGKVPVIAHVGTVRTADAIELAQHAASAGADAISMIPPYYYHFSMEEIIRYYEDILDSVPGLPGIIYNIPQFTGVEFNKHNAERLLENPQIIGIKHTSQNLYAMERMHKAFPEKIIFNGFDEQFLGAMAMGATAAIGTTVNLFAPLFLRVRELYQNGRNQEALEIQESINKRVEILVSAGIFNGVKYAWTLRGVDCGACRKPFQPLTDVQKKMIENMVSKENI
ncbi:MAG: N-acetylneuraminate lyase [Eubacteriales bacterium]|nr:N-acetylneuraminate lyase [Eubacteriales bacterium]